MGIRKGIRTAHPEVLLAPLEHLQLAHDSEHQQVSYSELHNTEPESRSNKLPQDDGEVQRLPACL
jgi:hypothetical protein